MGRGELLADPPHPFLRLGRIDLRGALGVVLPGGGSALAPPGRGEFVYSVGTGEGAGG